MKDSQDIYSKPDPVVYDTIEQTKAVIKNLEDTNNSYKLQNKNLENEVNLLYFLIFFYMNHINLNDLFLIN